MIELSKYQEVLDSGLILDHYHLLCTLRDGGDLPKSKRIQGFLNLLIKKGYVEDGVLTPEGLLLIDNYVSTTTTFTTIMPPIDDKGVFDFSQWAKGLHTRCQEKIKQLTGKLQVSSRINKGKSYSFLPNSLDLGKVLYKVITIYNLKDLDAIEKCMMGHIQKCNDEKSWFPLMKYYIFKADGPLSREGKSDLVTDLENLGDTDEPTSKSTQRFI